MSGSQYFKVIWIHGRRLKEYIEWKWNGIEGKKDLIGYVSSKLKSLSSKKIEVLRGWH